MSDSKDGPDREAPPKKTQKATSEDKSDPISAADIDPSKPVQELSPEEQLALYEKQLKEDDWGHQPC